MKEENEARSVDYDVELRKKDCRIRELEAAMSQEKEMHKATMKDLEEANKAVDESKQRFEQRKRAEDAEKEQEGLNFKTPSFRDKIQLCCNIFRIFPNSQIFKCVISRIYNWD